MDSFIIGHGASGPWAAELPQFVSFCAVRGTPSPVLLSPAPLYWCCRESLVCDSGGLDFSLSPPLTHLLYERAQTTPSFWSLDFLPAQWGGWVSGQEKNPLWKITAHRETHCHWEMIKNSKRKLPEDTGRVTVQSDIRVNGRQVLRRWSNST